LGYIKPRAQLVFGPLKRKNSDLKTAVVLFSRTNEKAGSELIKGNFPNLSFWSNNLETLARYYEGVAVEITVELDSEERMPYVREMDELGCPLSEYTYGFAEIGCPKGAVWYSFSGDYLKGNVVDVREIFPDLSAFNEEEI
jgi:hypothetical protein